MEKERSDCARCGYKMADRLCKSHEGKSPAFCPTLNKKDLIEKSLREYEQPHICEFARHSAVQEADAYGDREKGYARLRPQQPRIEEILGFARKMNYKRLGLAFCIGLRKEALAVEKLFAEQGFEVVSAICKVGRVPKEKVGVREEEKLSIGSFETMCNPILQAFILNEEKTEFNVLLGLCVGHDSLFFKYAEAYSTVLAVKDRMLGHNPLAAVYTLDSYYRSLKE